MFVFVQVPWSDAWIVKQGDWWQRDWDWCMDCESKCGFAWDLSLCDDKTGAFKHRKAEIRKAWMSSHFSSGSRDPSYVGSVVCPESRFWFAP